MSPLARPDYTMGRLRIIAIGFVAAAVFFAGGVAAGYLLFDDAPRKPTAACQIMEKDFKDLTFFGGGDRLTDKQKDLLEWYDDNCR